MDFLDLTLPAPEENLALDEALLLQAESGASVEILRFWEWPRPAVILGSGCSLALDVDESACQQDGVPILRRASGGGTVLLSAGCLCFSLVLAYERSPELRGIRSSYGFVLGRVAAGLADLLSGVSLAGISDLTADGRKFSGNAQQRKQRFLLHHGTFLYRFDVAKVSRYLREPARQPDYRGNRDHESFLVNLPVEAEMLKNRLRTAWQAHDEATAVPRELMRQLVADKYSREEWNRRR
jgi:lipoate-protein ligase A